MCVYEQVDPPFGRRRSGCAIRPVRGAIEHELSFGG